MSRTSIVSLSDCTEFRQTLAAQPPAVVHATVLLLLALLGAAFTWSALVKANLVVKAHGRVRPVEIPTRVFTAAATDFDGHVIESPFDEGDVVKRGDVLVKLDTEQIDNRIARLRRMIQASDEELVELDRLERVRTEQLQDAQDKSQIELDQARERLAFNRNRQQSDVRLATVDLAAASDHLLRVKKLVLSRAASEKDLVESTAKARASEEMLVQAQLPVDEKDVEVKLRALELVHRDFEFQQAELAARRVVKRGEVESARKELANLEFQRTQATLRAPIDGVVISGRIKPGDVLEPAKPVMEIATQRGFRFEAAVPSDDVGLLRPGMPVRIKFDAYDYQKYGVLDGTVTYISPDSTIEQSHASKATAAYVVRIELLGDKVARGNLVGNVKLGLGGIAEIVTGHESILGILVKKIRQTISLG